MSPTKWLQPWTVHTLRWACYGLTARCRIPLSMANSPRMSSACAQLPACTKCRLRKVRCDRRAPKCGNCTKGNVTCIIVDNATGKQYARDYVRQLEDQEAQLKAQLDEVISHRGRATARSNDTARTPRGPLTGETTGSHGGFVGDGSGLGSVNTCQCLGIG